MKKILKKVYRFLIPEWNEEKKENLKKSFKEATLKDWIKGIGWMILLFTLMIGLRQTEMLGKRCQIEEIQIIGYTQTNYNYLIGEEEIQTIEMAPKSGEDYLYYMEYYNQIGGKPPTHNMTCEWALDEIDIKRYKNIQWIWT